MLDHKEEKYRVRVVDLGHTYALIQIQCQVGCEKSTSFLEQRYPVGNILVIVDTIIFQQKVLNASHSMKPQRLKHWPSRLLNPIMELNTNTNHTYKL
jgi:hypothetical protein